jgi:HK97 gp10 family phage protein
MSVEVYGNRVILDNLDKLSEIIHAAVEMKMEDAATVGLQVAEDLVPVDTGFLRSRLDVEVRDDQIILTDDADYALFVELGTSKQSPQPFMMPGAVAAGDYLMQNLSGIL